MSVREYIGARYVPVLASPVEWDNTRAYEPLTIVLYRGNSYTSVQSVPVGVDINDASFWAETGNYNAQVEQYRQEVVGVTSQIGAIVDSVDDLTDSVAERFDSVGESVRAETKNRIRGDMDNSVHTSSYVNKVYTFARSDFPNWHSSVQEVYSHSQYNPVTMDLHVQLSVKLSGAVTSNLVLCELPSVVPYIPSNATFPYAAVTTAGIKNGHRDFRVGHDSSTETNNITIPTPTTDDGTAATYVVLNFNLNLRNISYPNWESASINGKASQLYNSTGRNVDTDAFNLLLSSDWHAQWGRANIGGEMRSVYPFDDHIMLGDILKVKYSDTDRETNYSHWGDTLKVLGNHDVLADDAYPDWAQVSGHWDEVDWTRVVPTATAYNRYFSPYRIGSGIQIQDGKCWWYKDYQSKKVKLIGLYCMAVNQNDRLEQSAFLEQQLNDAKSKGYQVIIANHWAFNYAMYTPSNFTDDYYLNHSELATELNSWEYSLIQLVDEFISDGGKFACWLVGHSHGDNIGYYSIGGRKQTIINMCAEIPPSVPQVYRYDNSEYELAFDGLQLNDDGSIVLTRYGCEIIITGGLRDILYM